MDKVLVLNSDYTPINITSVYRGFTLVLKGRAEILKSSDNPIITSAKTFLRPTIIRLLNYVKYRAHKLKINRHRLFKRDGHECVYCGSKRNLTVDHIIPKSKGGQNTWMNLVTSCFSCNTRKGDRTPEQAGMKMNFKPYEPTFFSESILSSSFEDIWNDFQKSFM